MNYSSSNTSKHIKFLQFPVMQASCQSKKPNSMKYLLVKGKKGNGKREIKTFNL
ncbi:hypothetical protein FDUTEX481_09956 [Tolypothrix sp. PCC 7601]|nr:hypothetical protein FDUTEX481_09956 [Tolypothrix sp. PCC 7601]